MLLWLKAKNNNNKKTPKQTKPKTKPNQNKTKQNKKNKPKTKTKQNKKTPKQTQVFYFALKTIF